MKCAVTYLFESLRIARLFAPGSDRAGRALARKVRAAQQRWKIFIAASVACLKLCCLDANLQFPCRHFRPIYIR